MPGGDRHPAQHGEICRSRARSARAHAGANARWCEPLSIDEAFLDLGGTERLHGHSAALTLAKLAHGIETEIGITVSIGLSHNKFLAKIASDLEKPRGFSVIGRAETHSSSPAKPVGLIWGVGKVMQAELARDGITMHRAICRPARKRT